MKVVSRFSSPLQILKILSLVVKGSLLFDTFGYYKEVEWSVERLLLWMHGPCIIINTSGRIRGLRQDKFVLIEYIRSVEILYDIVEIKCILFYLYISPIYWTCFKVSIIYYTWSVRSRIRSENCSDRDRVVRLDTNRTFQGREKI